MTAFDNFNLSDELKRAAQSLGYPEPTEIQAKSIPLILEGYDLIGRSATGSGKTAAFGIPAVELITPSEDRLPQVLVLCPTRELAVQICGEMRKYAKYKQDLKVVPVYGGQSILIQIRQLRAADIVVGTPGRVIDHIQRKTLRLDKLRMVVLDEADEMLNMGFLPDIETIMKKMPAQRQTLLFSATMPAAILALTKRFQKSPRMVEIESDTRTVDTVKQFFCRVPAQQKASAMVTLIRRDKPERALIFCNTKRMVDLLTDILNQQSIPAVGFHGDMRQSQRNQIMGEYKGGQTSVLVATDVAARGIDVDDIDIVYNFDVPDDLESYVHRIGRTARAGREGKAFSLVADLEQLWKIWEISAYTDAPIEEDTLDSIEEIKFIRKKIQKPLPKKVNAAGEAPGGPRPGSRRRRGGQNRPGKQG